MHQLSHVNLWQMHPELKKRILLEIKLWECKNRIKLNRSQKNSSFRTKSGQTIKVAFHGFIFYNEKKVQLNLSSRFKSVEELQLDLTWRIITRTTVTNEWSVLEKLACFDQKENHFFQQTLFRCLTCFVGNAKTRVSSHQTNSAPKLNRLWPL